MEAVVDDFLLTPPKLLSAQEVKEKLDSDPDYYYVIDMRGPGMWSAGHIPGSVPVTMGQLKAHVAAGNIPDDVPVVLVCHAGQQSGWAQGCLNLMGYDTYSLDWGMPGWNGSLGNMWMAGCSNQGTGVKDGMPYTTSVTYEPPEVEGSPEQAEEVVEATAAGLIGSFKNKTYGSISSSLDDYFIVALVPEAEYLAGHLPGAIRFEPGSALDDQSGLGYLPPGQKVLVYDCSGQGSSAAAAALNVLGYDAWFLKFGSTSLWCADLASSCGWSSDHLGQYEVEQ